MRPVLGRCVQMATTVADTRALFSTRTCADLTMRPSEEALAPAPPLAAAIEANRPTFAAARARVRARIPAPARTRATDRPLVAPAPALAHRSRRREIVLRLQLSPPSWTRVPARVRVSVPVWQHQQVVWTLMPPGGSSYVPLCPVHSAVLS